MAAPENKTFSSVPASAAASFASAPDVRGPAEACDSGRKWCGMSSAVGIMTEHISSDLGGILLDYLAPPRATVAENTRLLVVEYKSCVRYEGRRSVIDLRCHCRRCRASRS